MAKLFISYTRRRDADSQFANNLRTWLIQQGHAPWMDVYNIPAGANWDDEIDKALYAGDAVLGVVSSASVESDNVKNEWASAEDDERLELYLLLIEQCEIPYRFYRKDYIDFTKEPHAGWARLETTLKQRFPTQGQPAARRQPSSAKSRSFFMNPIVWIGAGAFSLLVLIVIVVVLLSSSSGSNNDNNGGGGSGASAAENAEAFVAKFFGGDIDRAVSYVCSEEQTSTRLAFANFANVLQVTGTGVSVHNISCLELNSSAVQCNYTLTYTNGLSEPVQFIFQTRDNLVCQSSLGF